VYDIYNEKIPEDLLWVIDEMTGLDEADREEMELGKFIEHEIGGLDKIFDPKVREIIQKKL
jgi:oligoribonuclease (3'-5' exoribonuclease)